MPVREAGVSESGPAGRCRRDDARARGGPRLKRLRRSAEWRLGGALYAASPGLTIAWWVLDVVRGLLPAAFAVALGVLVAAVQHGDSLAAPLTAIGVTFIALQALGPVHDALSANLGAVGSSWLHDRLLHA